MGSVVPGNIRPTGPSRPAEYHREPNPARSPSARLAVVSGPGAVLRLQHSVGNRAVSELLGGESWPVSPSVVQRQEAPWNSRVAVAKHHNDRVALFRLVRETLPPSIPLVSRSSFDLYEPLPTVNFDPTMEDFNAEGATVTPNGETPTAPTDPTAPIPQICVVLGRGALHPSSEAYTRAVLDHEWRHAAHFRRALDLVARWRRAGGRQPFVSWLAREHHAGRVSLEDFLLARERAVSGVTGTSVRVGITETYAPLEAFLNDFNTMPLGMPEHELFRLLNLVSERWFAPLDEEGRAMQRDILGRFSAFRGRLDPPHRAAFDRYVAANQASPFYQQLARFARR